MDDFIPSIYIVDTSCFQRLTTSFQKNPGEEAQNKNRIEKSFLGKLLTEFVNPKTETGKEAPKWVMVKKTGSISKKGFWLCI
jgi:hypothetical protein